MVVWGITDGSAGTIAQVKALASALGVDVQMKKILVKKPYVQLPNICYPAPTHPLLPYFIDWKNSDNLSLPWPDVIISCGRRAALASLGIKQVVKSWSDGVVDKNGNSTTPPPQHSTSLIHIQDPQMPAKYFDLVVAMEHDKIVAPNVIKTRFALHQITPQTLAPAREKFAPYFAHYPKPHVAVLLGGTTNKYALTPARMGEVITSLQDMLAATAGALLITPSRRTGAENMALLDSRFRGNDRVYLYDGTGDNPYIGMLACADVIVVTNDSVNMMSEALATGKPVYILPLPGHTHSKPAQFAKRLLCDGLARLFTGQFESWHSPVTNEMPELAARVRLILGG